MIVQAYLVRETVQARLFRHAKSGKEFWVPRSVCRRTTKFPKDAAGEQLCEVNIEDWWWESEENED
jgi:hypothetical protein